MESSGRAHRNLNPELHHMVNFRFMSILFFNLLFLLSFRWEAGMIARKVESVWNCDHIWQARCNQPLPTDVAHKVSLHTLSKRKASFSATVPFNICHVSNFVCIWHHPRTHRWKRRTRQWSSGKEPCHAKGSHFWAEQHGFGRKTSLNPNKWHLETQSRPISGLKVSLFQQIHQTHIMHTSNICINGISSNHARQNLKDKCE